MLKDKIISTFSKKNSRPKEIQKFAENSSNMIDEINLAKPSIVIDLGCGTNLYKQKIKNLIGIDILSKDEDITCAIEDIDTIFQPRIADVVLALGSINFGNDKLILEQLTQAKNICKHNGLIYFRCNHNPTHEIYYNWDIDKLNYYTKKLKFEYNQFPTIIKKIRKDKKQGVRIDDHLNRNSVDRIFLVWKVIHE